MGSATTFASTTPKGPCPFADDELELFYDVFPALS